MANAVDEAKDLVSDATEPSALAATSYWDDDEDCDPFGGVTYFLILALRCLPPPSTRFRFRHRR